MSTHNGTTSSESIASSFEHRFEGLKSDLKKLVERFDTSPEGYVGRAKHQIELHPAAAIGIAVGVGYLIIRLARWR